MEIRPFGSTGMQVSVVGLGGALIGLAGDEQRRVDELLGAALDAGVNVLDTAAMYGECEAAFGRSLRGRRDRCLLFTKCGRFRPPRRSATALLARGRRRLNRLFGRQGGRDPLEWDPLVLRWNIEQSLRRLRTDRIDLIQLHSCDEATLRRGEAIEVLLRARRAGKVRFLGYSDDGLAAPYAIECGAFDAIQVAVNVADQGALDDIVPAALGRGLGIVAKRSLANGLWNARERPAMDHLQAYWDRLRELRFDFLRGERAFEVALRFTVSTPVHTALVGSRDPAHLRENLRAAEAGVLDRGQFDAIRGEWRRVARPEWTRQV